MIATRTEFLMRLAIKSINTMIIIKSDQVDNCPDVANTDQLDGLFGLGDGVGDACDDDDDNDGDYNDVALFAYRENLWRCLHW